MIRALLIMILQFTYFLSLSAEEFSFGEYEYSLPELECGIKSHKNDIDSYKVSNESAFEITLSAECEPLAAVGGCVNVISGRFFQVEKDLKGTTIDPLDFVRYYDSGSRAESFLGSGWGSGFPLWATTIEKGARHHYGMISERENFLVLYRDKEKGPSKVCQVDPRILEKGYTNLSLSPISGQTNFVNWRATFKSDAWILKLGDGTKRFFDKLVKIDQDSLSRMNFPTKSTYLLTKEIKPNGNLLYFDYQFIQGRPYLKKVQTFNRTETSKLNELTFHYQDESWFVQDSCGHTISYLQNEKGRPYYTSFGWQPAVRNFLKCVQASQRKGKLTYEHLFGTWEISKINKANDQFLEIKYAPNGKVEAIFAPQNTPDGVRLYQFAYHRDSTDVFDAMNQLTSYYFDSHQRISKIKYADASGKTARKDSFYWSSKENEVGWLKFKSIGVEEHIYYLKAYEYDKKGNITKETLYGNLTGQKPQFFKLDQREEMDKSFVTYTYFGDDRNLLKKKSHDGLTVFYEYLEGTNLCTKTLYQYNGKIQERIFCTYDDNGELQTFIEDDGSHQDENNWQDVTFRKMKQIETVKEKGPSFGKPQKISEFYLNKQTGGLILLKETFLTYDSQGSERERKIVDSQGRATISTKVYDECLNLKEETNALGHVTRYEFDENKNKTSEELVGSLKKTLFAYDFANRLKEKREVLRDGPTFVTTYKYNALNQLISEIDSYDQETTYKYDRLGNQTQCLKPPMSDANGNPIFPTLIKEYNLLNQPISITNENGWTTHYSYNIYGNPTEIIHPDQAKEKLIYTPCGWLKGHYQADGTSVFYNYDGKGHLIEKVFKDEQGQSLKREEYHYKGPLLVYQKDSMGKITTYEYDGAGRKIQETIGHLKTIHYRYDDFDRLVETRQEERIETIEYDAIGRIIEKTLKEKGQLVSKESYTYDIQSNQITKNIWQTQAQVATYTSHYLPDGSLSWKEDPLHHRTGYTYEHRHPYPLGHFVKIKAIWDAMGRHLYEIDTPSHQLAKREIFENEKIISTTTLNYDGLGNCIKEHDTVMNNGDSLREYWIERSYNSRCLLEKETEMPQGKTTHYSYDVMKRLKQKVKPDGVTLNYTYDHFGRLKTLTSSDGTIAYTYSYDLHDNITQVIDHIHHIIQNRSFDLYNRLEKEEINPGIAIHYHYDSLDRLTKMTLPDGSFIHYLYDAYHIKKIQRFNSIGTIQYEIECSSDLAGNLLEMRSPSSIIHYTFDLLGREIKISSPLWDSHLEHFDAVGNLLKMKQRDPNGIMDGQFSYDRLNQLTSELSHEANQYSYDSLGNCLTKNHKTYHVNHLNQLIHDSESEYSYDLNGNLKTESHPHAVYSYDALNRLISCEKEGNRTTFLYDAFGRCLQISDASGIKHLLYQGKQEIGCLLSGQLREFRLVHPESTKDITFAIELDGQTFFPIQDFRGNICALQRYDGTLAEWYRYSAFGSKIVAGNYQGICNPWRFANRREVANLSLFAHRFYNPRLMRWQTTDPLGFKDGLNLYAYTHNNPFYYKDPDGRFALALPFPIVFTVFQAAFGATATVTFLPFVGASLGVAAIGYGCYQLAVYASNQIDAENVSDTLEEEKQKTSSKPGKKKPPYDGRELGSDLTKCPGEGFEWRGKGGPETGKGRWVKDLNLPTQESLHPDIHHLPPKPPHWDYWGPDYPKGAELYLDGTWQPKGF